MAQTLYLPIPKHLSDFESRLNEIGFIGWDLVYINDGTALFRKVSAPLFYKIIKVDEYMSDFQTTANTLGLDNWDFVDIQNGHAFFKQIAIN